MTDLQTLANVAEILGGATVIGAALFGVVQIRELRRQRGEAAALSFLQATQSPHMFRAAHAIASLPDGLSERELLSRSPQMRDNVDQVYATFETLGYMVYRGLVPLHVAEEFSGGSARGCFRKLARVVEAERARSGPNAYEWFQWLVDRMEEHPSPGKGTGAHVAFRDWRP